MVKKKKQQLSLFSIISIAIIILASFAITYYTNKSSNKNSNTATTFTSVSKIPDDVINSLTAPKESEATENNKYKVLNNNNPYFARKIYLLPHSKTIVL